MVEADGRIAGTFAFDCRSAEFHVVRAKAVVLATGAAGRLGLPASGYLFGTYENPTNAGDGYSMALHAGAELSNIECFQINPLIKDYNGPACAYVTGPLGGYTANSKGERFIECDYWSGQMMWEFHQELEGGNGPVFLKLDHLAYAAAKRDPRCRLLLTARGVGTITALAYITAVESPEAFSNGRAVSAWAGLTPTRYQSGQIDVAGRISRRGDVHLRTYLYEAANTVLTRSRPDTALKRWGLGLKARLGHKKAVVAVARKLAVVLHAMWSAGQPFRADVATVPA